MVIHCIYILPNQLHYHRGPMIDHSAQVECKLSLDPALPASKTEYPSDGDGITHKFLCPDSATRKSSYHPPSLRRRNVCNISLCSSWLPSPSMRVICFLPKPARIKPAISRHEGGFVVVVLQKQTKSWDKVPSLFFFVLVQS